MRGISRPSMLIATLTVCLAWIPVALAGELPEYPFVFVIGKADADLPPDSATCSMSVSARDPDPGKAAAIVDARLNSVLTLLGINHVEAADIESFDLQKQIITSQRDTGGSVRIEGYEVTRSVSFRSRQLGSLPPIEVALTGAPNIIGLRCQFDRSDRAAQEGELLTRAVHDARDRADRLAAPLGRHIVSAAAISQTQFDAIGPSLLTGNGYQTVASPAFKRSVMPDDLLVPSTIHLSASVNVLFKME